MRPFKVFIILILLFGISCTSETRTEKVTSEKISLEEKIGEMILIGFRGTTAEPGTEIHNLIKKHHVGGVVLYNRDVPSKDSIQRNIESPEQLKKLNRQLQSIHDKKLIISIDEEGGLISRMKSKNGFRSHLSHLEIGNINQADSTRFWASGMADELSGLGINMNFAPVVDLNINPDCPVIGKIKRSFSADPSNVINNSKIFIEEHQKKNIICVPKHFPGHGSANMDSHQDFTDVTKTWSPKELKPYAALIADDYCDIVMTAHVYNEKLDTFPSTLSRKIIDNVLKKQMKFEGVVISDDMQMGAINQYYGFEESIERAILAGVDIILLSNNSYQTDYDPEIAIKTIDVIKKMLEENKINKERINSSYEKIVALKNKM